ncbi:MAG: hypothetical protein BWK77_05645 [Verrucomicrobia bacterium A1]|nr:MAG: hypothetical protein BWK77_05645 [Verrucomicrobia bacterium A1]
MYRLVFLNGPFKGKRLAVQQGSVTIGRDPDCQVRVADDEISRKHAVIEQRADGTHVRDLGSMNGIVVNGQNCRESPIRHRDVIEIGRTRLQYLESGQAEERESRRIGHIQRLAFIAVVFVILLELAFLIRLSLWRKDALPPGSGGTSAATAAGTTDLLAEAEARLENMQRRQTDLEAPESAAPTQTATGVSQEIELLRADVQNIRQQVAELSETPAEPGPDTGIVAAAKTAAAPPPAETPAPDMPMDPFEKKALEMLKEGMTEITLSNYLRADQVFERIQIMAPDFLPAYIERARLYERRGLLAQAGEQWSEVLKRSIGTPLYNEAAAERIRISRAEVQQKAAAKADEKKGGEVTVRLSRRLSIAATEQEKFPQNDQFDEMRLLRVTLKSRGVDRDIDSQEIRVVVTFFDEDRDSREVGVTRAVVPKDALRVDGTWQPGAQQVVTAAYVVPRGFRNEELRKYSQARRYFGYLVQVYYRDELQDVDARPKTLLDKAGELQPPIHMGKPTPGARSQEVRVGTNAPAAVTSSETNSAR